MTMKDPGSARVRLDKWLWAARFYKTRSQASAAIKGGKAEVNDAGAKPSARVSRGDRVRVRKGQYEFIVDIVELAEKRGSAAQAQRLYVEDEASVQRREETAQRLAADRAAAPRHWGGQGRPTKKQRRELEAMKLRYFSPEDVDDVE